MQQKSKLINPKLTSYELTQAGDRYFDGLAEKFSRSLYQAPRGELRLAMLDYLLPEMLQLKGQRLLDVGGGLGQQAAWFAERGHRVTMTEPSVDMLSYAKNWHRDAKTLPEESITYLQTPLQRLTEHAPGPWPLITCHAVLEWLGDPQAALSTLSNLLVPGGQLSLMVFNRDALRFSNAVKGNLEKALSDRLAGKGKRQRLTPISPVSHAEIELWSAESGLRIDAVAGIRVFQDYLRHPPATPAESATLLALEKHYCRHDPHWRLGRYLLYTLTKPEFIE
ncbi:MULTISPECIES: methyltransferase domain-containing protein [unclassified Halomonas]|uniref:methyltransferase domain-containing protein n=1 Tax=unclassified Halomonas TaxID=2609666 RepID=UPI0007D99A57|nr:MULTISPECIES: methyltransferase domain-containing protein [unclassified Halomonas]MBT2787384.1 methyltransferase domain-containing protein [Halomonas sp. ISL-106]MBT2796254.1 methyltransferase domain-containing protein [Halomonas sp. ISL-104]OAL57595.1 SAM-dependent methyltransferase [Halomonas sp. ALS9]